MITQQYKYTLTIVLSILFGVTATAHAIITDGAVYNGYGTFTSSETGRTWLDLDSFGPMQVQQMLDEVQAHNFRIAEYSDVIALWHEVESSPGGYLGVSQEIGITDPDLHYTISAGVLDFSIFPYNTNPSGLGYAALTNSTAGNFPYHMRTSNISSHDLNINPYEGQAPMGVWAYVNEPNNQPPTHGVPEPSTMFLFGTGLAGLIGIRRKKKQQQL